MVRSQKLIAEPPLAGAGMAVGGAAEGVSSQHGHDPVGTLARRRPSFCRRRLAYGERDYGRERPGFPMQWRGSGSPHRDLGDIPVTRYGRARW